MVAHGNSAINEWTIADSSFTILDSANIPYLIAIGNHDYDDQANTRTATIYNSYFGQNRYMTKHWWSGGFYENGAENSYCVLEVNNTKYLFMTLEYGARSGVIEWANEILTNNADKIAIITTHSYMYRDGTRTGAGDQYNPKNDLADANDGEDLWNNFIKLHNNIVWAQSGHDVTGGNGTSFRSDMSDGGKIVNQALANYQDFPNAGDGYLRLVTFYPTTKTIKVQTYSPTLGEFLFGENDFSAMY